MAVASSTRGRPARTLGLPPRYVPIRRIARGGMSTLWCTEDTLLERRVAVKLLSGALGEDPEARRRFDREARAAAALSHHPHVVTIFDVGETLDGHQQPYIVMEYRAGGSLADAQAGGPVARERALRWIDQAARALDAAHGRGIVHRDVKPGNLLLDDRDDVAVADFGIAHLMDEATITFESQLFGTAAYLAPEQVRGEAATPASDRYALAVVAFELLTGRRPFAGEGFAAQAASRLDRPPAPASALAPGLPRAVDPVLARGLSERSADRWPIARAFAEALEAAFTGPRAPRRPSAVAQSAPAEPRLPATTPAHRPARIAAALALLAGVALAVALVLNSGGATSPKTSHVTAARVPAPPPRHRATHQHARPAPQPTEHTTAATQVLTSSVSATTATTTSAASTPATPPRAADIGPAHHPAAPSSDAPLPRHRRTTGGAPFRARGHRHRSGRL